MPSRSEYDRLPSELQDLTGVLKYGSFYEDGTDITIIDNDNEFSTSSTSEVLKWTIYVPDRVVKYLGSQPNRLRFYCDLCIDDGAQATCRIKLNSVVFVNLTSNQAYPNYQTKYYSKSGFEAYDKIQFYIKTSNGSYTAYFKNLKITANETVIYQHELPKWRSD